MRLNWGTSIVLVLVGFIGFIMFFFVSSFFIPQDELVDENYYEEGLMHDKKNVWKQNAQALSADLKVEILEDGNVSISWPDELHGQKISGNIEFLRPNNANWDVNAKLENEEMLGITFDSDKFVHGNYRLKVEISAGDKTYFWDKDFSY